MSSFSPPTAAAGASAVAAATGRSPCRRTHRAVSVVPILYGLSGTASLAGAYCAVDVYGENFFPANTTAVQFQAVSSSSSSSSSPAATLLVPVTFFTSTHVSFLVPQGLAPGEYLVRVANVYNSMASPPTARSYPGTGLVSTASVSYQLQ